MGNISAQAYTKTIKEEVWMRNISAEAYTKRIKKDLCMSNISREAYAKRLDAEACIAKSCFQKRCVGVLVQERRIQKERGIYKKS